ATTSRSHGRSAAYGSVLAESLRLYYARRLWQRRRRDLEERYPERQSLGRASLSRFPGTRSTCMRNRRRLLLGGAGAPAATALVIGRWPTLDCQAQTPPANRTLSKAQLQPPLFGPFGQGDEAESKHEWSLLHRSRGQTVLLTR